MKKILLFLLFLILTVQFFVVNAVNYGNYSWHNPFGTGITYNVTSDYGESRNNNTEYHYGIDYDAPRGKVLYAAQSGRVVYASFHSSFGNIIAVRTYDLASNANRIIYHYAHLEDFPANYVRNWQVNDIITKGDVLGRVGETGSGAMGVHLHFQVMNNNLWHQGNGNRAQKLAQTIDPKLFYPSIHPNQLNLLPTVIRSSSSTCNCMNLEYDKIANPIYSIDNTLINFVGLKPFYDWVKSKGDSEITIVDFMIEFDISTEKVAEIMNSADVPIIYNLEIIKAAIREKVN